MECLEASEGRARIGVTITEGSKPHWAPDTTLQAVTRRTKGIIE
jgi:hypothetical protein